MHYSPLSSLFLLLDFFLFSGFSSSSCSTLSELFSESELPEFSRAVTSSSLFSLSYSSNFLIISVISLLSSLISNITDIASLLFSPFIPVNSEYLYFPSASLPKFIFPIYNISLFLWEYSNHSHRISHFYIPTYFFPFTVFIFIYPISKCFSMCLCYIPF